MPTSNQFILNCSDISSIDYLPNSFVVTEGQESSPPPTISSGRPSWSISIDADRQNNGAVASSFNQLTGGSNNAFTNAGGDTEPEELNFFFGVSIGFQINEENYSVLVYLGQGHYGFTNNWWIGGNTISNTHDGGSAVLHVVANDKIMASYKISGSGAYTMTLSKV